MNYDVFYNRTMDSSFIKSVLDYYPWLIDFVKENSELDFQTTNDKISIYRGTSKIFGFTKNSNNKKPKIEDIAESYKKYAPDFFLENPTKENFVDYLKKINNDNEHGSYYITSNGVKNEGYYQTLVGRRFTFFTKPEDEFIIIDKEASFQFINETVKNEFKRLWAEKQKVLIDTQLKEKCHDTLPKDIFKYHEEIDFLAMTWDGDIIIMELKQNNSSTTSISPIQVYIYNEQFKKLQNDYPELEKNILDMVKQKVDLGFINLPKGRTLPQKLSGKIKTYVIVGKEQKTKKTTLLRYKLIKQIFLPELESYTCNIDGSIIDSIIWK